MIYKIRSVQRRGYIDRNQGRSDCPLYINNDPNDNTDWVI